MELGESLPSHSMFVHHVEQHQEAAANAALARRSVELQSPPPPPPPPPLLPPAASLEINTSTAAVGVMSFSPSPSHAKSTRRTPSSASASPKPFLRKGSRIEPSAANRNNKSPSPVTLSASPNDMADDFDRGVRSGSNRKSQLVEMEGRSAGDAINNSNNSNNGGGNGGGRCATSSTTSATATLSSTLMTMRPTPQHAHHSRRSAIDDDIMMDGDLSVSLTDSSTKETTSEWKARRTLDRMELDEFALLEKEVEGMALDPFATTKSLRYSIENAWTPSSSMSASASTASAFQPQLQMNLGARVRNSNEFASLDNRERSTPLVRNSLEDARVSSSSRSATRPSPVSAVVSAVAASSESEVVKASRPSIASLRDVPGVTVGTNLQNDYGIYDFDEDNDAGGGGGGGGDSTSHVDNGYANNGHSSAVSEANIAGRRIQGVVDDSHSWGAVTRPNQDGDYTSTTSWSASPLKPHQQRQPSPQLRPGSSAGSRESRDTLSSSSAMRPVLRPPTSSSQTGSQRGAGRSPASRSPAAGDRSGGNISDQHVDSLKKSLSEKARELEQELATYRQENSQLKNLRRQQEQALQEVSQQRGDLLKYIAEEKKQTETWCEEQRNLALKDRRSAAKLARDSRQSVAGGVSGTSVRKDRAEIEALQATIEKMKVDADVRLKKTKVNEQRLNALIKEHSQSAEDSQSSLTQLENEALTLWNYLDQAGIRIPASILGQCKKMAKIRRTDTGKSATQWRSSYVEEVDVPEVTVGETRVDYEYSSAADRCRQKKVVAPGNRRGGDVLSSSYGSENGDDGSALGYGLRLSDSDGGPPTGPLAAAILRASPGKAPQSPYDPSRYTQVSNATTSSSNGITSGGSSRTTGVDSRIKNAVGEILASSTPPRAKKTATATATTTISAATTDGESIGLRPNASLAASWARSSRSSHTHSSRYSNSEEDNEDEEDERGEGEESLGGGSSNVAAGADSFRLPQETRKNAASHLQVSPSRPTQSSRPLPLSSPSTITINTSAPSSSSSGANSSSSTASTATATAAGGEANTRTEEILADGRRVVRYRNGTIKEVYPDGRSLVKFVNGDTKLSAADGSSVLYYYAAADTTHTTYKDGLEVYEFPNNQVEKNYPDGTKEIIFPDSTRKVIHPDKTQISYFPDGVIVKEHPDLETREIITPGSSSS